MAEAGVLFVQGVDDQIYRYDGATGRIDAVSRASTFDSETTDGVYVVGRHGGAELLKWDGSTSTIECGTGYADVSREGACASAGQDGVEVMLADDVAPRLVLPADWRGSNAVWSPDGRRLLLIRTLAGRATPGLDPGLSALWLMEADGRVRELYRPPDRGILNRPSWSPDGRQVLVWHVTTTSASFAADGVGITARVIDVSSGAGSILGTVMNRWVDWAPDGRLAFVRGGGRGSWDGKDLFVREPTGAEHEIRALSAEERVALAPSWDRSGTRLAWVSGPEFHDLGGTDYMAGVGPGKRTAVIDEGGQQREIGCDGGRVVEGVRWSASGNELLLLCRKPGQDARPLELWLHRLSDGSTVPLVTNLVGPGPAAGFGYYGAQPHITTLAAWSLAVP